MQKLKFSNTIDFIFINFVLFLIVFTWLKFINKNIFISFIISFLFIIIFNILRFFLKRNKEFKVTISKNLENDIEQYMLSFLSNTKKENLNFFNNILTKDSKKTLYQKNLIVYDEDNIKFAICPIFFSQELKIEESLRHIAIAKNIQIKKLFILCPNVSKQTKLFLESFKDIDIKILEKKEIFVQLLKPANKYPNIIFEVKENKKLKLKQLISISFNKTRAKHYFFSGLFIFFCSFIVKYNFYYVFMSSILFLFTIFCFIKKQEPIKNKYFFKK